MRDKLLSTARRYVMFAPGDTVAAGVSGGADSMCMLVLLKECAEELGIIVTAVHVNHGLRGAEADADESFVRDFCEKEGIPFIARRVNVPALVKQTGDSAELCARNARYEVFASLGFDKIATAHTGTDSVETLLMNLSRGAGLRGLCGIPPVRGNIVRPLIGFTRAETERFCRERGIAFVTDSTNLTNDCTRNRFRHTVMNDLAALNPAFERNAMRCMELLRRDEAYLDEAAEKRFRALYDPETRSLPVEGLPAEGECLRNRVLARYLDTVCGADYEYRHVERLGREAATRCSVTLPSGGSAVSDGDRIAYREPPRGRISPGPLTVRKDREEPVTFGRFQLVFSVADLSYTKKGNEICVDYDKTDETLTVRARQPGDRILLPRRCAKTLKKYFNEIKLPERQRDEQPVICDSRGIAAVAGLTADETRLPDNHTKKILIIRTECDNNDE
ncbi:MAG: tRNA lysidine(34) synthetase TilS [Clostridia bacterium]|nr:tRNA lysidine(34) synthetase TilS [Clostridia bacterium]